MNDINGMIGRLTAQANTSTHTGTLITQGMSTAARNALISVGTNRQGAIPAPITPLAVLVELQELGLIGNGNGLTRRGTIKREAIMEEELSF